MEKVGHYLYHEMHEFRDCSWIQDGKKECLGHLFYTDQDANDEIESEIMDAGNTAGSTGRCSHEMHTQR
jgi:hypothetical protein